MPAALQLAAHEGLITETDRYVTVFPARLVVRRVAQAALRISRVLLKVLRSRLVNCLYTPLLIVPVQLR